jgi:vacuolar protein sorting-associated protein 29
LITGHTHKNEVYEIEKKKYLINPGSVTGAYSAFTSDVIPSFILMAIKGNKLISFVYALKEDGVDVSKTEYVK